MALIKCPECGNEVSSKASACPRCGCPLGPSKSPEAAAPPPLPDAASAQPAKGKILTTGPAGKADLKRGSGSEKVAIACGGCLGVAILLVIVAVIGGAILRAKGPDVTVTGDRGVAKVTVQSNSSLSSQGLSVAQEVYRAAMAHPQLKQLAVNCELNVVGGAEDKFGNKVEGPLIMGQIAAIDLDEVRRYKDEGSYALDTKSFYANLLRSMNYSNLLSQ